MYYGTCDEDIVSILLWCIAQVYLVQDSPFHNTGVLDAMHRDAVVLQRKIN